ncbi:MAG: HD domain-containing protein, partial [Actinobacteria bacterium]|nr:HD domain-containing protein [Actinomycetota bacterium]
MRHNSVTFVRNNGVAHSRQMKEKIPPRWQPGIALHCAYMVAAREFAGISRKGGDIPYLSHLMAVSALVMEHGGTEDQAAAALLHDVLEDSPITANSLTWELMAAEVPAESAHNIVAIVQGTSDGVYGQERTEATWHERKTAYHRHLAAKLSDDPSILVSLADKVHNAESTLVQVRAGET